MTFLAGLTIGFFSALFLGVVLAIAIIAHDLRQYQRTR